jgi:hypothetical protein
MKMMHWCAAALAVLLAASGAQAQNKDGKKLYRWVDKDGKVHYDDALPPEAVDQARREFNAKTGTRTGSVDRALTESERAAAAQQQQAEAAAALEAEQLRRNEEAMITSYATESDLRRAYDERISLLKQTLESTDVGLRALRGSLASLLAEASESELANRPVDKKRAGTIRQLHNELLKQQIFQKNRQAELLSLDAEFVRVLQRYRELRAPSLPPPAPVTAPPGNG